MRSFSVHFGWLSLLGTLGCLSGCGSSHDEVVKRLAVIQADLSRLQHHSDRLEERLQALEMRKESRPVQASGSAGLADHPRLLVVKLEPGEEAREPAAETPTAALREEDSAADTSPRPVIRVYGSRTDVEPGSDGPKRKR